ncbi:MAG TPA: hypothetical protein VFE25_04875 [Opitutaceae bacterium]|nr:hypothetical protein [Opitutaceae bacterium]
MKFLRILLTGLVILASLAVLCVLVLVAPAVQTWVAQHELSKQSGVTGTVGSVSAGFGAVTLEELHLESAGAVLTLPSFQAKLSVTDAVLHRRAKVTSLVADGWTLDLSHASGAANAASARDVALLLGSLLRPWDLPVDLSVDDVEMEGDVLLPSPSATGATHMHVRLTGGGMGAGREGAFVVESSGDLPAMLASTVGAHGNLQVAMDTPRTFRRLRLTAGLTGLAGSSRGVVNLSAQAEIPHGGGPEILSVQLTRANREILSIATHLPKANERLDGGWKVDLRDADIAPFAAGHPLPSFSATGSGGFDADLGFESVHVTGLMRGNVSNLALVSPLLARTGAMEAQARLEFTRDEHNLRVSRLEVSLATSAPLGTIRSVQSFDIDEKTGSVKLTQPAGGWLDFAFTALPVSWIPELGMGFSLTGNEASGEIVLTPKDGGFILRPKSLLVATGVTLLKDGRVSARALDLSASLEADLPTGTWELRLAPLVIGSGGRQVAKADLKFSRQTGDDPVVAATGKWTSDISAMAAQGLIPVLDGFSEGKASGDFTASLADSVDLEGNLVIAAQSGRSISSAYHLGLDPGGAVSFVVPLKITGEKIPTDISAEGTWSRNADGNQIDLKLTGSAATTGDLLLLAAPLALAGSGRTRGPRNERDTKAFWGDWTGHVVLSLDKLVMQDRDLAVVGGVFDIDHGQVRLTSGHGGPEHHNMTNISGILAFDAAGASPYTLKATSAPFEVDAKTLFPVVHPDDLPTIEGHFSVAPSLVGAGVNYQDLVAGTEAEFRISSTSGIVRLLGANVGTSFHERSAPMTDTLGTVGSVVGGFLGSQKAADLGAKNHLSKPAEAALDLGNQLSEIGCDLITLTARRTPEGSFTLSGVDMAAPGTFLRGSGTFGSAKGTALQDQALSLDLRVGAKGKVAELLATAGIAVPGKDAQGFTLVSGMIHFGGTPAHVDATSWQQMLATAANRAQ